MPSSVGPNTFGEENLVFGYDLGDTVNSYKGEPTTNLITHVLPNSNWNTNGSGVIITQNYGYDHNGVLRSSKIMDNPNSGNASFAYTSAFSVSAGTYTFSAMVKTSSANASSNSSMVLYNMNPITNLGETSFTGITPEVWTKVSVTGTLASGTTHIAPHFFSLSGDGTNFIEVVDVQLEQKSHATPFAGPLGTRSSTQGLIDLKGTSTIDLTNVSFDSNAQMTFDGTNDLITLADAAHLKFSNGSFTVEQVLNINSISGKQRTFSKGSSGWTRGWHAAARPTQWEFELSDGVSSPGNGFLISTATTVGTNHVVWAIENAATAKLYVNGVQVGATQTITEGINFATTTSTVGIGAFESGGEYFNGRIPYTKLYSRALTAQEVASNFKAIKSRFGI